MNQYLSIFASCISDKGEITNHESRHGWSLGSDTRSFRPQCMSQTGHVAPAEPHGGCGMDSVTRKMWSHRDKSSFLWKSLSTWPDAKTKSQEAGPVDHRQQSTRTRPCSLAFPGLLAGSWTGGSWDSKVQPKGGCWSRWQLHPLYHNAGPCTYLL